MPTVCLEDGPCAGQFEQTSYMGRFILYPLPSVVGGPYRYYRYDPYDKLGGIYWCRYKGMEIHDT